MRAEHAEQLGRRLHVDLAGTGALGGMHDLSARPSAPIRRWPDHMADRPARRRVRLRRQPRSPAARSVPARSPATAVNFADRPRTYAMTVVDHDAANNARKPMADFFKLATGPRLGRGGEGDRARQPGVLRSAEAPMTSTPGSEAGWRRRLRKQRQQQRLVDERRSPNSATEGSPAPSSAKYGLLSRRSTTPCSTSAVRRCPGFPNAQGDTVPTGRSSAREVKSRSSRSPTFCPTPAPDQPGASPAPCCSNGQSRATSPTAPQHDPPRGTTAEEQPSRERADIEGLRQREHGRPSPSPRQKLQPALNRSAPSIYCQPDRAAPRCFR